MLVKARKEGIVRHLRDAVSTQRRTARRPCLNSIIQILLTESGVQCASAMDTSHASIFPFPFLFLLHVSTLLLLSSPLLLPRPPFCFFLLAPCLLCASLPLRSFGSFFVWYLASISAYFSMSFRSSSSRPFRIPFSRQKTDMLDDELEILLDDQFPRCLINSIHSTQPKQGTLCREVLPCFPVLGFMF